MWLSTVYVDGKTKVNAIKIENNKDNIESLTEDVRDLHRVYYPKYRKVK